MPPGTNCPSARMNWEEAVDAEGDGMDVDVLPCQQGSSCKRTWMHVEMSEWESLGSKRQKLSNAAVASLIA